MAILERDKRTREELISLGRGENIGLQARLLIGKDYLDPSRELKKDIKLEDLEINPETYKPLERLSELERKHYWKDREDNDPKQQKEAWAQAVVKVVEGKKDYFGTEEGKHRKSLYKGLGIDIDGFDQGSAVAMYDHFFAPSRRGREVERFADKVLGIYTYKDANGDDAVRSENLKKDIEAYVWLGNIFGKGSSLIASELITAQGRLKDKSQKHKFEAELNQKEGSWFGGKKRRIDRLSAVETDMLGYMNTADKKGELIIPPRLEKYLKSEDIGPITPLEERKLPPGPEMPLPADFIDLIDAELKGGEDEVDVPLELFVKYLKTIRDKEGAGFSDIRAAIKDKRLFAKGVMVSRYGTFGVQAIYGNSGKKITLKSKPKLNLLHGGISLLGKGFAPGQIKDKVKELHETMTEAVNGSLAGLHPEMEVGGIQIEDEKVKFSFKRK